MSVSLDYLSALVKWVASTLMVQFFCHYSAVVFYFFLKKKCQCQSNLCHILLQTYIFLYKYIFDRAGGG